MNDDTLDDPRRSDPGPATGSEAPPFWSPWATVGWSLVVALVFVVVQTGVGIAWLGVLQVTDPALDARSATLAASNSGNLFAMSTIVAAVICSALLWAAAGLKRGARNREALALAPTSAGSLAAWLAATVVFIVVCDTLSALLGRPIVPEFMTELYRATTSPELLWLAVVIAAPFFEELFFRGFMFEGFRRGPLGDAGAVVTTSCVWAAIHLQYDLYDITIIFVFGLVLGWARLKSRSLWAPVAMHTLTNLVATVETILGW